MSLEVTTFPDPNTTPFKRWAQVLTENLATYNPPSPLDEGLWLEWAAQLFAMPEVVDLGVSDPHGYQRWQDWATSFLRVPN